MTKKTVQIFKDLKDNKAIPNKNIGISPKILYNMFMPPHSPNTSECPPLLSNPC